MKILTDWRWLAIVWGVCLIGATPLRAAEPEIQASDAPPATEKTSSYPWWLGLSLGANVNFGRVPSSDTTNGFGYSISAPVILPLAHRLRNVTAIGYEVLGLTRTIDGSGYVIDLNPAVVSQQVRALSLSTRVEYQLTGVSDKKGDGGKLSLWGYGGFDFLYPLSVHQSDNLGDSGSVTMSARYLLAQLGVTTEIPLQERLRLEASVDAGYNLTSASGNQLITARLLISAVFLM